MKNAVCYRSINVVLVDNILTDISWHRRKDKFTVINQPVMSGKPTLTPKSKVNGTKH